MGTMEGSEERRDTLHSLRAGRRVCGGRQRQREWFIDIYTAVMQGRAPQETRTRVTEVKAERRGRTASLKSRINR